MSDLKHSRPLHTSCYFLVRDSKYKGAHLIDTQVHYQKKSQGSLLLRAARDQRQFLARYKEEARTSSGNDSLLPIMRLTITVFLFLILGATSGVYAQRSKAPAQTPDPVTRKLVIDPSSTSVPLGKARLIVSPLTRRGGNYVGDYQLKVRPYFFKSETGTLILGASEDSVRDLQAGRAPIEFTGRALTREDGTTHMVLGRATPSSAGDHGSVTFSIVTEKGKFIFKPSYHFETKSAR